MLFLSDESCDRLEDAQILGNNRIFRKNAVLFESVCFNNGHVITQHTQKCIENRADD